jgi:hypothetical protein
MLSTDAKLIDSTILGSRGRRRLAALLLATGLWFGWKFMVGFPLFVKDIGHWIASHGFANRGAALTFLVLVTASYLLYGAVSVFCFCVGGRMLFPRIVLGTVATVRDPSPGAAFLRIVIAGREYSIRRNRLAGVDPQSLVGMQVRLGIGAFPFHTTHFIEIKG